MTVKIQTREKNNNGGAYQMQFLQSFYIQVKLLAVNNVQILPATKRVAFNFLCRKKKRHDLVQPRTLTSSKKDANRVAFVIVLNTERLIFLVKIMSDIWPSMKHQQLILLLCTIFKPLSNASLSKFFC